MVRKVNKGLSFVEVIIALAIFMLMMVPIVSSLMTSMKTTGTAKELQSRNEYAQKLVESMKEVPIDKLSSPTPDVSYFEKLGSEDVTITYTSPTYVDSVDPSKTAPYEKYVIQGKTYLGAERTQYAYIMEMSSEKYAKAEVLGKTNPNNLKNGVVQDIDQNKVALISSATISNYDTPAYEALRTKKISVKRDNTTGTFNLANAVASFNGDTGNRITDIKISGDASSGYDVICTLYYSDNCNQILSTGKTIGQEVGMIHYQAYKKHFAKLPDIYLMYNLCVYNDQYANDYITYDTTGLDDSTVNVFVVETASDYSESVKKANTESGGNWLKGSGGLYQKAGSGDRDDKKVGMALAEGSKGTLNVYHNMYKPTDSAELADWNDHKKNEAESTSTIATTIANLFDDPTHHRHVVLPNFSKLNEALDANRGLYEIKVWMQEGDTVVTTTDPILQGTRGGVRID